MYKITILLLSLFIFSCNKNSKEIEVYGSQQVVTNYYYHVSYYDDNFLWYKEMDSLAKKKLKLEIANQIKKGIDSIHFGTYYEGDIDDQDISDMVSKSKFSYSFDNGNTDISYARLNFGNEQKEGFVFVYPTIEEYTGEIDLYFKLDEPITGKDLDKFVVSCEKQINKYGNKNKKISCFLVDNNLKKKCSLIKQKESKLGMTNGYKFEFY